jgi:hypothetical protein
LSYEGNGVEASNQFLQTVDMGLTNGCGPGRMIGVKSGDVELRPIVFYSTSFTPSVTERDGETGVPAAGGGDAGFNFQAALREEE